MEILGGGLAEPILVSLPVNDRQTQLLRMAERVEQLFGRRPTGAWLTERVWEPDSASDLARAGYAYTIVDNNHLRAANVPRDGQWGTWSTDDQGHRLTLFASDQELRYAMPWAAVEATIEHLRRNVTDDRSRIGMMGDDGEKFGGWPGTFNLCWGSGAWMQRFLAAVRENADWLDTVRPIDWMAAHPPLGRVYVPTASYVEMTEWALPPDLAPAFHDLLADAKRADAPTLSFLFGGFWRAFQARYREVNDLHKQMLRASAAVAAMPVGARRDRALEHLLRGQSNDVYWHGLFGGIYMVHLRLAVQAELIAARDLIDNGRPPTSLADLDLDGVDEVQLGAEGQSLIVDVAEGAGIGAWDLFASRLAVGSSMRRRPEAYHERLRRHFAQLAALELQPEAGDAGASTTTEAVILLDEGLEDLLVYDRHEQRGALITIRDLGSSETVGPSELARLLDEDLGDFADGRFEIVELRDGQLRVIREGSARDAARPGGSQTRRLTALKRFELSGTRLDPALTISVEVSNPEGAPHAFELGLSFAWNMAGGGHNPAAYYRWRESDGEQAAAHDLSGDLRGAREVAFGNASLGLHIGTELDPPGRITWFPIETVSRSEGGYEKVYQASSLHCRWPIKLAGGANELVKVTFRATQSHDLAADESRDASRTIAQDALA